MSISKILELKESECSNSEKLERISALVSSARANYGNSDTKIEVPEVNTASGSMSVMYISDASKIELVKQEASRIRIEAIEAVKATPGTNGNKVIEALVATSAILVNISETSDFELL